MKYMPAGFQVLSLIVFLLPGKTHKAKIKKDLVMSYFNQRGIFLQLMLPSPSEPNTLVSMQLARKEEVLDAETETVHEKLVDSIFVTATSSDQGANFSIRTLNRDVDGDRDIDSDDKAKLQALAKAYANIVNP
jgi:hypothetical protein